MTASLGLSLLAPISGWAQLGTPFTVINASSTSNTATSSWATIGNYFRTAGTTATAVARATVAAGRVEVIEVANTGAGYPTPPAVTITGGNGSGATAVAVLSSDGYGRVISIVVTNKGSGYANPPATPPTVTIAAPPAPVVGGVGSSVHFYTDIGTTNTINLDGARTVGQMIIGDLGPSNSYVLAAGTNGTLTFNNGLGSTGSVLNKFLGVTDTISAPVILADQLHVRVTTSRLNITGNITGNGNTLTSYGNGLLSLTGNSTGLNLALWNRGTTNTGAQVELGAASGNAVDGNITVGNASRGTSGHAVLQLLQGRANKDQISDTATVTFDSIAGSGRNNYFKLLGGDETVGQIVDLGSLAVIQNREAESVGTTARLTLQGNGDSYVSGFIRDNNQGAQAQADSNDATNALQLTKNGTGTFTMTGGNIIFSGGLTVGGGQVVLKQTTNFRSHVNLAAGSKLILDNTGTWNFLRTYADPDGTAGSLRPRLPQSLLISGNGDVEKTNNGILNLTGTANGNQDIGGSLTVRNGTLNLMGDGATGAFVGGGLFVKGDSGLVRNVGLQGRTTINGGIDAVGRFAAAGSTLKVTGAIINNGDQEAATAVNGVATINGAIKLSWMDLRLESGISITGRNSVGASSGNKVTVTNSGGLVVGMRVSSSAPGVNIPAGTRIQSIDPETRVVTLTGGVTIPAGVALNFDYAHNNDGIINGNVTSIDIAGKPSQIGSGATSGGLYIVNSQYSNNSARLPSSTPINMRGGVVELINDGVAGFNYSQQLGAFNLVQGTAQVANFQAALNNTSVLQFASLNRSAGATVEFVGKDTNGTDNWTQTNELGTNTRNQIKFTTAPTLDDGIIGGWAYANNEFVKYGANGVTRLLDADYFRTTDTAAATQQAQWSYEKNVKLVLTTNAATITVPTRRAINSLNIQPDLTAGASSRAITLGAGAILSIESGGILASHGTHTINGNNTVNNQGYVTVGTPANTPAELVIITGTNKGTNGANALNLFTAVRDFTMDVAASMTMGSFDLTVPANTASMVMVGMKVTHANLPPGTVVSEVVRSGNTLKIKLSNSPTAAFNNATVNFSGGSVGLTKAGPGTLVMPTASQNFVNTFTGPTVINNGTLRLRAMSNLGTAPAAFVQDQLRLNGGTLQFGQDALSGVQATRATDTVYTISDGKRGVTFGEAGGRLEVGHLAPLPDTRGSGLTVPVVDVRIDNPISAYGLVELAVRYNPSVLENNLLTLGKDENSANQYRGGLKTEGGAFGGIITINGKNYVNGLFLEGGRVTFNHENNFSGAIRMGSGTELNLMKENTYNGQSLFPDAISIASGTLNLYHEKALGSAGFKIAMTGAARLKLRGTNQTLTSLSGAVDSSISNDYFSNDGLDREATLTVNLPVNEIYNGKLRNGDESLSRLNLVKTGAGRLSLTSEDNDFSGTVRIEQGVLDIAALGFAGGTSSLGTGNFGDASEIVIGSGAALSFSPKTQQYTNRSFTMGTGQNAATLVANGVNQAARMILGVNFSAGVGTTTSTPVLSQPVGFEGNGARTLILSGVNAGDNEFQLQLSDKSAAEPTSLLKAGPGTWLLGAAGDYSGQTTVQEGILAIGSNDVLGTTATSTTVALAPANTFTGDLPDGLEIHFTSFYGSVLPAGIAPGIRYYVVNPPNSSGVFQVATSKGGTPVTLTTRTVDGFQTPPANVRYVPVVQTVASTQGFARQGVPPNQVNGYFTGILPKGTLVTFSLGLQTRVQGTSNVVPATFPGGIVANEPYYVIKCENGRFEVSKTPGGASVEITTNSTGNLYYTASVPGANNSQGVNVIGGRLELRDVDYATPETMTFQGGALSVPANARARWAGNMDIQANTNFTVGAGGELVLDGSMLGNRAITQLGEGTVRLSGEMVSQVLPGTNNSESDHSRRNWTLQAGTLILDYTHNSNSKLLDTATFVIGGSRRGGILRLQGSDAPGAASHEEVIGGLSLQAGANKIYRDTGTSTIRLNTVSRAEGSSLYFDLARIASVDNLNVNNILGGWAIIRDAVVQANWVIPGTVSRTFIAEASSDFMASALNQPHFLANGTPVQLTSTGTLPAPLMSGVPYYVVSAGTRNFKLSALPFGTPIDLTTAGTGTHTVATFQAARTSPATLVFTANSDNYPGASGNDIFRIEIVNSGAPGAISAEFTQPAQISAATPLIYKIITTTEESSAVAIEGFVNTDSRVTPYFSVRASGVDNSPDSGHYGPAVLSRGSDDNGSQELGWARNGTQSADGLVQVNSNYQTNNWQRNFNVNMTGNLSFSDSRTAYTLRFATNLPVNVALQKNTVVPNLFTVQTGAFLISPTVGANDSIISGNGDLTTENDGNLRNFLIHQYNQQGDFVIGANLINRKPVVRRGRLTSGNRRILSGLSTTADLQVGAAVTGTGIPTNSSITKIYEDGHTVAINNEATGGDARNELTFTVNGSQIRRFATQQTTTTQNRINGVFDPETGRVWTGDIYLNMPISGPGIPVGAVVDAIFNDSDIRINTNHFFNAGNLDGGFDSDLTFQPSVGLEKLGGGTLILSGDNTYAGPTVIADGVLRAQKLVDAGLAGSLGVSNNTAGNLVFNGGTLQYTGENSSTNRSLTYAESATINIGHEATTSIWSGSVSTSGTIGATDRFVKAGSGTLEWRGNANVNEIQVAEGKLRIQTIDTNYTPSGFGHSTMTQNSLTSLRMGGGILEVRGTPEGNVTQTFGGQMYLDEGTSEIRVISVAGYDPNNLRTGAVPRTTTINLMGGEEITPLIRASGGVLRFVEQPEVNSLFANILLALPEAERAAILPWAVYQNAADEAVPGVNNFAQVLNPTSTTTTLGSVVSADNGLYNIDPAQQNANNWGVVRTGVNASEGGFDQVIMPSKVNVFAGSTEMQVEPDNSPAYASLRVGMLIEGPGVPAGTTIVALQPTFKVIMSQAATADSSSGQYVFQILRSFYGAIDGDRSLNTLRYYNPIDSTFTIGEGKTLRIDGGAILVGANVRGAHKQILGEGNLTGFTRGDQGGDFIIHNYSNTGLFTIGANVVDSTYRLEFINSNGTSGGGYGSVTQGSNIMNVLESATVVRLDKIIPGMEISGPGIAPGTYVVSVVRTSFQVVMSKPATSTYDQYQEVYTFRTPTNFLQTGIGTTVLAGNNSYTGKTFVQGGVLRLDSANAIPGGIGSGALADTSSHIVVKDGVIGLGQGNFTRFLGTADNQIEFKGSGGFAAYGADRVVDFGGLGAAKRLRFGNDGFVMDGSSLILGALDATHKVSLVNSIDLGSFSQAVKVMNGPADIEGELSGVLSGLGRLIKFGQGSLRLSGQNVHTGGVELADGRLVLANVSNVLGTGTGPLLMGTSATNTPKNAAIDLRVEGGNLDKDIKVGAVNSRGPDWIQKGSVDGTVGNLGSHSSMAIVNGNPAIAYYDSVTQDLKYVRATDNRGTSWTSPMTLASRGDVGQYPSLAIINGNPAVSYYDATNGTLCYIRSTDTSGVFWGAALIADANPVNALARQPADGKVIVGGSFVEFDGVTLTRLVRLSSEGVLEAGFAPSINGEVRSIVVQADGKIVIAGAFTKVANVDRNNIARLNANGSLDTGYNPNAAGAVRTLLLQPDGNLLVGGAFTSIGGQSRNRVARLTPAGTADSFNPNADNEVRALALQADGSVIIGGAFTNLGGSGRNRVARVDSAGALQPFNPNVSTEVRAIVVDGTGQIYLGGLFQTVVGTGSSTTYNRSRLTRLTSAGAVDTNYAIEVNGEVREMKLLSNGQIAIMGTFTAVGTTPVSWLARLNSDGKDDSTFVPNPDYEVRALVEQPDGKLLVGGVFSNIGGATQQWVGRLNTNGTADSSFLRKVDNRGAHTTMTSVVGNPAIAYQDVGRGDLYYIRATDNNGATWTSNVLVDGHANNVGVAASMDITNIGGDTITKDFTTNNARIGDLAANIGSPAVAYFDATTKRVKYVLANDANGADWSLPVEVAPTEVLPSAALPYISLKQVNGAPAVAFATEEGDLVYFYATNIAGMTNSLRNPDGSTQQQSIPALVFTEAFGPPAVLASGGVQSLSLEVINSQPGIVAGTPAVAFRTTAGQIRYISSLTATGATGSDLKADWPVVDKTADPEDQVAVSSLVAAGAEAGSVSLVTADGVPGISYKADNRVKFVHLTDAAGYSRLAFAENTTLNGALQLDSMAILSPDSGKTLTVEGVVSGTGGFRLSSTGTVVLNNAGNAFGSGMALNSESPVVIRSGHLLLGSSTALGTGSSANLPRINLGDRDGSDSNVTPISVDFATTASVLADGGSFVPTQQNGTFVNVKNVVAGHTFTNPADSGKRILVKNETANPAWNGVYRVNFVTGQPANTMNLVRVADLDETVEFVYNTPVQIPAGPELGQIYYLARRVPQVNTSPVLWSTTILVDRATTGTSITNMAGSFDKGHNGLFTSAGGPGAFVAVQTTIDGRNYTIADVGTLILVKDEQDHPEWNGVYEIIYSPTQPNGTMNLVRVPNMDEVSEFGYGTPVQVAGGTSAGKTFFLASSVTAMNSSAVRWVEEQWNADLSLRAGTGQTINNNIDVSYRVGAGTMTLGASSSVTTGNTTFDGAITLKNNSAFIERQTLNLDSSIETGLGVRFRGVISESGVNDYLALQKVGTGVVTLSGDSSFKGGVSVNQGTLLVMNTAGSATGTGKVQVNAGAVLGGTGRIGGAVELAGTGTSLATLRMGDPTISGGIENLTINGPLTVGPNSVVEFTLSGVNQFTKLTANNGITLTETGRLLVKLAEGYVPTVNDQFKILDLTGPLNLPPGAALGNYLKLPGAYTWDFANFATTGTIRMTGNTTAVTIPESGQPLPVTVNPGPAVTVEFTVTVAGSPEFVYQWQRMIGANWVDVGNSVRSSSTTNKLTKTGIQEEDEGLYRVKVTNGEESFTVYSNSVLLSVNNPPVIVQQPEDAQADPNGSATFVVRAGGPSPYTFQWKKSATNINNGGRFSVTTAGDTSTLVISGIVPADEATDYNVVVSNSAGQVVSRLFTLDVREGISFVSHPASVTVSTGDPAFFRVIASGTGPFEYQWQLKLKDAAGFTDIAGETGDTLRLPDMRQTNSGDSVRVKVSSPVEPAGQFSNVATITVTDGVPSFLEVPASKTVLAGTDLVLTVKVGGTQQGRSVVWKRNNGVIRTGPNVVGGVTSTVSIVESTEDGALVSTLTVRNISTGMGGQYSCDAKNANFPKATPTDPQHGKITVVSNPGSIVPVQNGAKTATLSVVAVGPAKDKATITYKWLKDGAVIVDPDSLPVNLPKLTIKNVSTEDAGVYTCEVTGTGPVPDNKVIGGTHTLRVYTQAAELDTLDLPPAMVGSAFTYQVPVNADPSKTPDSYAAKGLPPGLKLDAKSGLISGRPTKDGTYSVVITAKNKFNPASVSPATELKVLPVPSGAVGVFAGWLPRGELNDNVGGRYDMTVAATGALTGKVTIGAVAYAFKGNLVLEFDENDQLKAPNLTVEVLRAKSTPLTLTFTLDPANDRFASASVSTDVSREIDGEIQIVTLTSPINGWRNKWSAKVLPATPYLNELSVSDAVFPIKPPTAGYYTFALMPPAGSADVIPQGDSYATFTVNPDGKLSMVGKTADGQAITGAQFVGPAGEIVVYQMLYKNYKGTPGGSLVGQIYLNKVNDAKYADNTITSVPATAPTWSSPAYAAATSYAAGFGPLTLTATGGAYEDPNRKQVHSEDVPPYPLLLGIVRKEVHGGVDLNKDNAQLEFSLEGLMNGIEPLPSNMNPNLPTPGSPTDAIDITAVNKVVVPVGIANPFSTTLSATTKTGIISGKFILERFDSNEALKKVSTPFQGVIVKTSQGLRGVGYYLAPKQGGQKTGILSNQVLFSPYP